jgi:sugar phosphate isomerase/epimerase
MKAITSPAFGIDMDPSHIYRANENPAQALPAVLSRVRHIHIRDCKGRGPSPGEPCDQACGRGDIDLRGYFKAMVDVKYEGPVCLEVIGAGKYELGRRDVIAAESYGYMNACLKALGVCRTLPLAKPLVP